MGLILDVVLCIIALVFVISGFKAGLVRSLVELIGYVFAIIASIVLSDYLVDVITAILAKMRPVTVLGKTSIKIISIIIIFILLQILVQLVSRALDAVCRLPGLHILNSLLGGIFGLIKGVLVVFIICAVLQLTLPYIGTKFPEIKESEIRQSSIYKYVYSKNPVYLLYQGKFRMR